MENFKNKFKSALNNIFLGKSEAPLLLLVYIIILVIFFSLNNDYLRLNNIKNILGNLSIPAILSVGLTPVILSGNIDISIGSTYALSGIVVGLLYRVADIPVPVAILAGLLIGLIVGAINGLLVIKIGVNSIIATLGMMSMIRGVIYVIGRRVMKIYYQPFLNLARIYIFEHIQIILIYFLVFFFIMYFILKLTKFGKHLYAIGADEKIASFFGINIRRNKFITFLISGGAAAIGGVLSVSVIGDVTVSFGSGTLLFEVITACILGGISVAGGRGSLIGVFVAIFILGSIRSGLVLADVPINLRELIFGMILILALVMDSFRVRKRGLSEEL